MSARRGGKCHYCGLDEAHCACQISHKRERAHEHVHDHKHGFEWKELAWLALAMALLLASVWTDGAARDILRAAAYLAAGWKVLLRMATGLLGGRFFDENVLMSVATIGAVCLGDYAEAAAVMLFYGVGESLEEAAVRSSRRRIIAAVELHPDRARRADGGAIVKPEEIAVGEAILVKVGERVPLDGTVIAGESLLDVSMLTGEPRPVRVSGGDEAAAGSVNTVGPLTIRVTRPASESSTSRLLRAVEDAMEHKPALERFISRFARWYTPAMIAAAVLLAVIAPLLGLGAWSVWIRRALIFLVISCPCALVLSIPLTFFAGLAVTSRHGLLCKGADALERLPRVKAAVLDKTGTLTEGKFAVQRVRAVGVDEKTLLSFAAAAERHSLHPVAKAVARAGEGEHAVTEAAEYAGRGVTATVDGRRVAVGNRLLMEQEGVAAEGAEGVFVALDGKFAGAIEVGDRLRDTARDAVTALNRAVGYTAMLTGDGAAAANAVGGEVGVTEVFAALQPAEKLERMREIRARVGETLFVGDGINDAPVLAGADVGVAMGLGGAEMAAEAADALLLTEDLTSLPRAIGAAERTLRTARINIVLALAIKTAALALGALGFAGMWMAVVADTGAACLCVLHALLLLRRGRGRA